MPMDPEEVQEIRIIEGHMMSWPKFAALSVAGNATVRMFLYPLNLARTRLQAQVGKEVYTGTFHAIRSVLKHEGPRGLYRGVGVNIMQSGPAALYLNMNELFRHTINVYFPETNRTAKASFSAGGATLVCQTIAVPLDVVTQHLQMLRGKRGLNDSSKSSSKTISSRNHFHIPDEMYRKRFGVVRSIVTQVYSRHGIGGFWNGYFVSVGFFALNGMVWWPMYDTLRDHIFQLNILPGWSWYNRHLLFSGVAGISSSIITSILTNWADVLRLRIQLEHGTLGEVFAKLRLEEGKKWYMKICYKGLSARLLYSSIFGLILPVYELTKHYSLTDEYKDKLSNQ